VSQRRIGHLSCCLLSAIALTASLALAAARTSGAPPPPDWLVLLSALHKAPAGDRLPPSLPKLSLSAARGECEGAQIALIPGARLIDVTSDVGTDESVALALFRLDFIEIQVPSNAEGRVGRWPDPLIPERDPATGQRVPAFLQPAQPGEPTLLYVELCVPNAAKPGARRVHLDLSARRPDGEPAHFRLPIELRVHAFALPATSTFATSFGFSSISAAHQHGLAEEAPPVQAALTQRYAAAALRHRVSLHGLSMEPPALVSRDPLRLDFTAHDAELAPLLDGTLLPSGARATSFDVRLHPALRGDEAAVRAYFRLYAEHLRQRGWLDQAFFYVADEPREADLPDIARRARLVRAAAPGLRVLVAHALHPQLDGAIDIWAANLNCLFERPGDGYCPAILAPERYAGPRKEGARLWWYQSCGSHGCADAGGLPQAQQAYFEGWPSYMIDHDAALNRSMGALAFAHGIDGEIYFNTVEAWHPIEVEGHRTKTDPWRDVLRFHGNGDGTLFYPGTPQRLGSAAHMPIESLRLKHLRDGLEDFEYLALAQGLGLRRAARAFIQALVPSPWQIQRSPEHWDKARQALARAIEAR
jgi:hypothetical protein